MTPLLLLALQGASVTSAVRPLDPAVSSPYPIGTELVWEVVVDDPERGGAEEFGVDLDGDGEPDGYDIAWAWLGSDVVTEGTFDYVKAARLMPLEGGTLTVPPFGVRFSDGEEVLVEPIAVEVRSELLDGEDAPRPAPGFRDVEEGSGLGDPRIALAALVALLAVPLMALAFLRRGRSAGGGAPERAPAVAPRRAARDPALEPRTAAAAVGPLVRLAAEQSVGASRPAATDQEWATWLRGLEGPGVDLREDSARLVEEASELRFRGDAPTSFAAKDLHGRATALVQRLGGEEGAP
ncbi:MAG: hypothetical protein VX460_11110 [Planctomycetota bacterium]|nr:hypothetical protein [Planctomycetota bacterium]